MIKVAAGTALSLSLLACSSAAPAVGASVPDPDPGAVVTDLASGSSSAGGIVKIQTRDRSVTLFAAERGVRRFTVEDDRGRVIARKVDLGALETLDARAYDLVKSTVVTGTAMGDGPTF